MYDSIFQFQNSKAEKERKIDCYEVQPGAVDRGRGGLGCGGGVKIELVK